MREEGQVYQDIVFMFVPTHIVLVLFDLCEHCPAAAPWQIRATSRYLQKRHLELARAELRATLAGREDLGKGKTAVEQQFREKSEKM